MKNKFFCHAPDIYYSCYSLRWHDVINIIAAYQVTDFKKTLITQGFLRHTAGSFLSRHSQRWFLTWLLSLEDMNYVLVTLVLIEGLSVHDASIVVPEKKKHSSLRIHSNHQPIYLNLSTSSEVIQIFWNYYNSEHRPRALKFFFLVILDKIK